MKKIIVVVFIGILFCSFSEKGNSPLWEKADKMEAKSSYGKAVTWFTATKKYRVNISYASFIDQNIKTAYERSRGFYKRSGNSFYSSSLGNISVQNDQMRVAIDTVNKMIVLAKKAEISEAPVNAESVSKIISVAKEVKKIQTGMGYMYRIEFNPNGLYDTFEFEVNAKGQLLKLVYYYGKPVSKSEKDIKTKPRVEIYFSDYQTEIGDVSENDFSTKKYFEVKDKKIVTAPKYKSYTVKDYRFNEK